MKHINIPIFIPHLGCPNQCVFCNQRSISGRMSFDPSLMEREVETVLSTVTKPCKVEIAFFGGSFTGIPAEEQEAFLSLAFLNISSAIS